MKKNIIITTVFFILSVVPGLFPRDTLMAQPQRAQAQDTATLSLELLETYSLPDVPVTADDIPGIKAVIQDVLSRISESLKGAGLAQSRADVQPIMSAILVFQDWLTGQRCVKQASNWYVKAVDDYDDDIFISYPGEVPFDILFNMGEDEETGNGLYRLMIFVNTVDLLRFASLAENKTIITWPSYQPAPYLVPSSQ